ncbi:MAG TPA: 1,4-alpha-glucan branching protein domain-containing protein [Candidatus Acidoferrum sp.]|jgi:1,4-alpha-glucan branching enzyme|nr:1,4-alpha-glucan branching protein domain-containing protein [Candidatus Acidoferrum sp.]
MPGYFSLVLHAHLPFVRHPEHEQFLEESWLFEAITESYVPLLQLLERWQNDGVRARLTLTLTPTLCAMLQDPLLQSRYARHLDERLELAEQEVHRTLWEKPFHALARFYHERFLAVREFYRARGGDLVVAFRKLQDAGQVEIITSAATHALLPLLTGHPPSLRAQILVARDHYRSCFGRDPRGIWLPECGYAEAVEPVLKEANLRWFITDTHGLLHARPRPRCGVFAPIITPAGLAAFGRDHDSAKQVWSRDEGYPGDPRYRDFYRDIGFDLDLDYLQPYLPAPGQRTFTGIKYHRITGGAGSKAVYDRAAAARAADEHAAHFLAARRLQIERLAGLLPCPPLVLSPYDAELFGHWWYEGPEFLDFFVRKAFYDQKDFTLVTPEDYLGQHPTQQAATPGASSWGEGGYWRAWLNETNHWIYPHLQVAQQRMTELVCDSPPDATGSAPGAASPPGTLRARALKQAARELLLAQASDWSFILRTGTSPEYAADRVKGHLVRFTRLYDQIRSSTVDEPWLASLEAADNLFPDVDYRYWA